VEQPQAISEYCGALDVDLTVELFPKQLVDGMKVNGTRLPGQRSIGCEWTKEPAVALRP